MSRLVTVMSPPETISCVTTVVGTSSQSLATPVSGSIILLYSFASSRAKTLMPNSPLLCQFVVAHAFHGDPGEAIFSISALEMSTETSGIS